MYKLTRNLLNSAKLENFASELPDYKFSSYNHHLEARSLLQVADSCALVPLFVAGSSNS